MKIAWITPTYRRPRLLENLIACYLAQDYPADQRELVILDDAGQIRPQTGDGWRVLSTDKRYPSLPEKYAALFSAVSADCEAVMIAEDDDIYLPHATRAHAAALRHAKWSKPARVLSTFTGSPVEEGAAGRFFASIAVSRSSWEIVGGLPITSRGDFDQQFLSTLTTVCGPAGDPLNHCIIPGYCFRWGSTGAYHGQAFMQSAADQDWYTKAGAASVDAGKVDVLRPRFDDETRDVMATMVTSRQI